MIQVTNFQKNFLYNLPAEDCIMSPLQSFPGHRDAVMALS